MKPVRTVSKKRNRIGWQFRATDPVTRKRKKLTFWFSAQRDAQKAFDKWLEGRELTARGLPDPNQWDTPFTDLVERFLAGENLAPKRRKNLTRWFAANELNIARAAELAQTDVLTAKAQQLARKKGGIYVQKCVQAPLRQLTRWCQRNRLLPLNPLQEWPNVALTVATPKTRAFTPQEMAELLERSLELDALLGANVPQAGTWLALLLTGNRPTAVFNANRKDLIPYGDHFHRITLPEGHHKKFNGLAAIPTDALDAMGILDGSVSRRREFGTTVESLRRTGVGASDAEALQGRAGNAGDLQTPDSPLLTSPAGCRWDTRNAARSFEKLMIFTAVRRFVDTSDLAVEVAQTFWNGTRGRPGPVPKADAKVAARRLRVQLIEEKAATILPHVAEFCRDRYMYSLRHTHITWARALTNPDSVNLQVGHAGKDVEERHYTGEMMDLIDARKSAQAVWRLLQEAQHKRQQLPQLPLQKEGTSGEELTQAGEAVEPDRSKGNTGEALPSGPGLSKPPQGGAGQQRIRLEGASRSGAGDRASGSLPTSPVKTVAPIVAPVVEFPRGEEETTKFKAESAKRDKLVGAGGFEPPTSCTPSSPDKTEQTGAEPLNPVADSTLNHVSQKPDSTPSDPSGAASGPGCGTCSHPPIPPDCEHFQRRVPNACVAPAEDSVQLDSGLWYPISHFERPAVRANCRVLILIVAALAEVAWRKIAEKWASVPFNDCKNFDDIAAWKAQAEENARLWRLWGEA